MIHDWTRVDTGVFHDFHQAWIHTLRDALNGGILPDPCYALAEQVAQGPIPDVAGSGSSASAPAPGGVLLANHPPRVRYVLEAEEQAYARKADRLAIHHSSGDQVVAYLEIVSRGNRTSRKAIERLLRKFDEAMARGCHLLVVDLHPPTPRDPDGLHALFWSESFGEGPTPGVTPEAPLSLAAYRADLVPTAYFEPVSLGQVLPPMPLFLTPERYVDVPLEETYPAAWQGVPRRWKSVLE